MKTWLRIGCVGILLALGLSACLPAAQSGGTPAAPAQTGAAVTASPTTLAGEEQPQATDQPAIRPPLVLTVWLPPEFDPNNGTPAGDLLRARLDEFMAQYPTVRIDVRIKAASGSASLLNTLSAASPAAPAAVPDLVALPRPDLERAALKGVIVPWDGPGNLLDETDWFGYARELAFIQDSPFGLPFAGDALILAYRPAQVPTPPADWEALLRTTTSLLFAAGSTEALYPLALYQTVGGPIRDEQGRPTLDADFLQPVLEGYRQGSENGLFPIWLAQLETDDQAWQAYREQRGAMVITWASRYLAEFPADTLAQPLPSMDGSSQTVATGWLWALPEQNNADPERRAAAVRLAEFLTAGEFLAQWTEAAGYLPTRPTALAAWRNASLQTLVGQIVPGAHARPTNDVLAGISSPLREATLQVIQQQLDPATAASQAAARLAPPEE